MSCITETDMEFTNDHIFFVWQCFPLRHGTFDGIFVVERFVIVCLCFSVNDTDGVFEHKLCDLARGWCRINLAFKSFVDELWNTADMVEVCVGYKQSIDGLGVISKRVIIFIIADLHPLKEATVDQDLCTRTLEHVIRTCHLPCRAVKSKFHSAHSCNNYCFLYV